MGEHEHSEGRRRTQVECTVAAIVGVPLFYVLSTGPVSRLVEKIPILESFLNSVYAPIIWLSERFPPVMAFFEGYLKMWEKLMP